jgi:hypothetical protein
MTVHRDPERDARARNRAVDRLRDAQAQLTSARARRAKAGQPAEERTAAHEVAEWSEAVSSRKEWLYWVDHHESVRPEADGEWAPEDDDADRQNERWTTEGGALAIEPRRAGL